MSSTSALLNETSRQSSFERCPPDVAHIIASHITWPRSSLRNLRLVSKVIHDLFTPIVLRHIALRTNDGMWLGCGADVNALLAAADETSEDYGFSHMYQHARRLTMFLGTNHTFSASSLPGLKKTLSKLRGLRSLVLEWDIYERERNPVNQVILELISPLISSVLIATGGILEELTLKPHGNALLNYGELAFPSGLLSIHGLKKLVFNMDDIGWTCQSRHRGTNRQRRLDALVGFDGTDPDPGCLPPNFKPRIRDLIRQNPNIEELCILQGCAMRFFDPEDLFVDVDEGDGLKLERLELRGMDFPSFSVQPSSKTFVKMFQNLTDLRLNSPMSDMNLDNLWLALHQANVHSLVSLATSQVSPSFITFVSSFTGLRKLILHSLEPANAFPMPGLANRLFTVGLPPHASTLRHLSIDFIPNTETILGWAYDASVWVPLLSQMTALEALGLHPRQGSQDFDKLEQDTIAVYQEILDGISQSLQNEGHSSPGIRQPRLRAIQIHWPQKVYSCEMSYVRWLMSVQQFLEESIVGKLKCKNGVPETLILESGTYQAVRGSDEDGLWGYTKISEYRVLS